MPLAVAVAALWYGPMYYRHGWTFVDQFIIQHHVARFVSNKYHHPQPFYFYFPVFALLVLPWTVVLISALVGARRWKWRAASAIERLRLLTLVWIALPIVFFSLSGSKIPGYILPVLPAGALLIGDRINGFLRNDSGERVSRITGALLLVGGAIGTWYAMQSGVGRSGWFLAAGLAIVAAALFALFAPRARAVSFLLVGVSVILACAIGLKPARAIADRESVRELMRKADARGYSSAPVLFFLTDERTAEFYASGRLLYQTNGEPIRFEGAQQLPSAIRAKGDVGLVIMETRWEKQLTDYKSVQTEKIGSNGLVTLFVVRPE
jgi:4-amino-4-deoxy-L-arabinose transferase-like glycosyltransferase